MHLNNLTTTLLLPLLLILSLGCADTPTEPELTEEEIKQLIADEIAKMNEAAATGVVLTPQEIAEIALRSTVVLKIEKEAGKATEGSGFVVGEGQVAVTYHQIDDMKSATVRLVNVLEAYPVLSIVAVDTDHDLAIVQANIQAPPLALGDSDEVRIGDSVFVAGNPDGYVGSFSVGIIAAIRNDDKFIADKVFQMTAAVSPGSSGGPVLNRKGEVIAIVVDEDTGGQNLNFAVPVNFLKALLKAIQ